MLDDFYGYDLDIQESGYLDDDYDYQLDDDHSCLAVITED